jgi:hypothetical protein
VKIQGTLDLFGLSHLLRAAEASEASFSLEIRNLLSRGGMCVRDGMIFWARAGQAEGEEAVRTLLGWKGAEFWIYPLAAPIDVSEGLSASKILSEIPQAPSSGKLNGDARIEGTLGSLALRDVIHIFGSNGRPAGITVNVPGGTGEIHISSGLILAARLGKATGREALDIMMNESGGAVTILGACGTGAIDDPLAIDEVLHPPADAEPEPEKGPPLPGEIPPEWDEVEDPDPDTEPPDHDTTGPFQYLSMPQQLLVAKQGNFKAKLEAACYRVEQVAMAVVMDRNYSVDLAEAIAAKPNAHPAVLHFLATDYSTRNSLPVARALIFNPSTALPDALELLAKLKDKELRGIVKDKGNHPAALVSKARQLLEARQEKRAF